MLSDGDIITVGDERFRCESIFQAKCWLVRPAKKESNCTVIVCDSHVMRFFFSRDGNLGLCSDAILDVSYDLLFMCWS